MGRIKKDRNKDIQITLFSATIPTWVKGVAESYLKPNYQMIDLCQNLKNKTAKTVKHYCINVQNVNKVQVISDICKLHSNPF
jgi:superfamily II DNA/RNA helicase